MTTSAVGSKPVIYFGNFVVTPQVFYITPHSFAFVNLKPLLQGHVLVSPRRITPRLRDLTDSEVTDLFLTVQRVGRMIERVYNGTSLNVAMQDGVDAGQSVPHVHTHVIPRGKADLDHKGGSDAIHDMLEGAEGNVGKHLREWSEDRPRFPKVADEAREPRSKEQMADEAQRLAQEMEFEKVDKGLEL